MKKKVLHLLASSKYSGAENVACTIIKSMSDEYEMYYCSPNGEIKNALNEKKITFIPLKKLTINEVAKVVKEISPHVIHAHDFKASLIAASFSKKATIVSHIHKNDPQMRKLSLKSLLYLLSAKNYKKIIGVSEAVLSDVIHGKKDISRSLAKGLEYALGVPTSFWLNLQDNYDSECLSASERK